MTGETDLPTAWGDRELAFHRCKVCGCTTQWAPLKPVSRSHVGVNARLFDPAIIANLPVRKLDNA